MGYMNKITQTLTFDRSFSYFPFELSNKLAMQAIINIYYHAMSLKSAGNHEPYQ